MGLNLFPAKQKAPWYLEDQGRGANGIPWSWPHFPATTLSGFHAALHWLWNAQEDSVGRHGKPKAVATIPKYKAALPLGGGGFAALS